MSVFEFQIRYILWYIQTKVTRNRSRQTNRCTWRRQE